MLEAVTIEADDDVPDFKITVSYLRKNTLFVGSLSLKKENHFLYSVTFS